MSYSTNVEAYLYACTHSSPANVLANYGGLEKSGRFFPEVLRLGLTGSSSLISETASTFLDTTPCINETYKPGRRCMLEGNFQAGHQGIQIWSFSCSSSARFLVKAWISSNPTANTSGPCGVLR